MSHQIASFGLGGVSFILYIAVFLVAMRFRGKLSWLHLQVLSAFLVHLVSTALFFYAVPGFLYWYSLAVFAVAWFAFFLFSTAIYVSISALILRTLDEQNGHSMELDGIYEDCIRKPFRFRASFFAEAGLVELQSGRYRITGKGRKTAEKILSLRDFLGMQDGCGLYDTASSAEPD